MNKPLDDRSGITMKFWEIDPSYLLIDWETDDNIQTVREKK